MEIIRSPREMAEMRKAGLLVWQAIQLASPLIRPGVATREIDAVIDRFFAEHHAVALVQRRGRNRPLPRHHLHLGQ